MGRPAKTLTPETGSVGSNPTLSAILLAFGAIFSHLWKRKRHCFFGGLIAPDPVENLRSLGCGPLGSVAIV